MAGMSKQTAELLGAYQQLPLAEQEEFVAEVLRKTANAQFAYAATSGSFALAATTTPAKPLDSVRGDLQARISVNPRVCHGKACVRGTRIMVSVVIDNIAAGVPRSELLQSYPALTDADVDAALTYAAELTREGTIDLPLEADGS